MGLSKTIWASPSEYIRTQQPDNPVLFFAPTALQATARRFIDGFPGLVTYAVKSNPDEMVIQNLIAAGVNGFDVASPYEIEMIGRLAPGAAMHFNNPVRARHEIAFAVEHGVTSYSVDSHSELRKLAGIVPPEGTEVSVRFKLPVKGSAYNFGAKFGATAEEAVSILREVAAFGFTPSITFHPGTQVNDLTLWEQFIGKAAWIAKEAGVRIARLNVGGGFPSHRTADGVLTLEDIFATIGRAADAAFGADRPALLCEPGRGMVADAFASAARVKAIRDGAHVFLNDGVYGSLAEMPVIGMVERVEAMSPGAEPRTASPVARIVFGPTCDSVDRLPGDIPLPADLEEGDFLVFHGVGAYSTVTNTRFNGFGELQLATVMRLRA
ncbi:MAG: type III PLP-dependent enzyme [Paracoccaceae bacterium]